MWREGGAGGYLDRRDEASECCRPVALAPVAPLLRLLLLRLLGALEQVGELELEDREQIHGLHEEASLQATCGPGGSREGAAN